MKGHNEGSIRQRKDGRWEVRISAGTDFQTGKPKRISRYAKNKTEAVKLLQEMEYEYHFNHRVDPTSMTVVEWLNFWLETYMKNSLKQSTFVSYETYIRKHFAPAFQATKLKELTSWVLQDFYNYKLNVENLSPKTIINMHRCLHKALKQAVTERFIEFNPCDGVNLPKNEKPDIQVLTRQQQERLMYASYQHRYGVFVRLALMTGLRLGELLGLRWENADLRAGIIHIRQTLNRLKKRDYDGTGNSTEIVIQTPKTKNSIRSIPLLPQLVNDLHQWRNVQISDAKLAASAYQDSGLIVTNPLGGYIEPRTFKDYYNQILQIAGIGHFTFHALRHTFATRALEQNMESKTLSSILGHYSVAFTLDTYAHVLDSQKRESMKLMEEFYTSPTLSQNRIYPVVVTPVPDGFLLNAVDFDDITIKASSVNEGYECILSSITEAIEEDYPPMPTPCNEIITMPGEFLIMVTV